MAKWTFEPGHTATEFRARHMMVTYVPPCTALRFKRLVGVKIQPSAQVAAAFAAPAAFLIIAATASGRDT